MANQTSNADKLGLRLRWLFLLGGAIYLINGIVSIFRVQEVNRFLGIEMEQIPYALLQIGLGILLLSLYVKNQKKLRQMIKDQVAEQMENEEE